MTSAHLLLPSGEKFIALARESLGSEVPDMASGGTKVSEGGGGTFGGSRQNAQIC